MSPFDEALSARQAELGKMIELSDKEVIELELYNPRILDELGALKQEAAKYRILKDILLDNGCPLSEERFEPLALQEWLTSLLAKEYQAIVKKEVRLFRETLTRRIELMMEEAIRDMKLDVVERHVKLETLHRVRDLIDGDL